MEEQRSGVILSCTNTVVEICTELNSILVLNFRPSAFCGLCKWLSCYVNVLYNKKTKELKRIELQSFFGEINTLKSGKYGWLHSEAVLDFLVLGKNAYFMQNRTATNRYESSIYFNVNKDNKINVNPEYKVLDKVAFNIRVARNLLNRKRLVRETHPCQIQAFNVRTLTATEKTNSKSVPIRQVSAAEPTKKGVHPSQKATLNRRSESPSITTSASSSRFSSDSEVFESLIQRLGSDESLGHQIFQESDSIRAMFERLEIGKSLADRFFNKQITTIKDFRSLSRSEMAGILGPHFRSQSELLYDYFNAGPTNVQECEKSGLSEGILSWPRRRDTAFSVSLRY